VSYDCTGLQLFVYIEESELVVGLRFQMAQQQQQQQWQQIGRNFRS
jgi:hypothetical protein